MKGSATFSYSDTVAEGGMAGGIVELLAEWTSDAAGDVDVSDTVSILNGRLAAAYLIPGAPAPTTGYSIYLYGTLDGVDYLVGAGIGAGHATNKVPIPGIGGFLSSVHDILFKIVVSGAGAEKKGSIKIHFKL